MDKNKPLTAEQYRRLMELHLNSEPPVKGDAAAELAKARSEHFAKGSDHIKRVAQTLQELAAKNSDSSAKKKADMALASLNDAQTAFGMASLCQGDIFSKDDT